MWTEVTNDDKIVAHVLAGENFSSNMCDEVVIHQLDEPLSDVVSTVIQIDNPNIKITLSLTTIEFNQLPASLLRIVDEVYNTILSVRTRKVTVWKNVC